MGSACQLLQKNDQTLQEQISLREQAEFNNLYFKKKYEKLIDKYKDLEFKMKSKEVQLKKDLKSTQAILSRRSAQVSIKFENK
jgi:hypothetical protein